MVIKKKRELTSDENYELALNFIKKQEYNHQIEEVKRLKTDIVGIDWLFGGGVPYGRIVEIFGGEGSGKSTLCLEIAKVFQSLGKCVLYADFEHTLDLSYIRNIGLNVDSTKLWICHQPYCLEFGADAIIKLVETGRIGLVIIDSVPSMVPKDELEGKMVDTTVALQARLLAKLLRRLVGLLSRTQTTVLFINQVRDRIGWDARWNPITTPGGRALKFYASVRLELKLRKSDEDGASGHRVFLRKQKTSSLQSGAVEFSINKRGIDKMEHFKTCLLNLGIVKIRTGVYHVDEIKIGREDSLNKYVKDNKEELTKMLYDVWNNDVS